MKPVFLMIIVAFLVILTIKSSFQTIICYISYMERGPNSRRESLLEESNCGVCSRVVRYVKPSNQSGLSQPALKSTTYICFSQTSTLQKCQFQCHFLIDSLPQEEFIRECSCCQTDRCNGGADNSLLYTGDNGGSGRIILLSLLPVLTSLVINC